MKTTDSKATGKKIRTSQVISAMWALGMPTDDSRYADIMRAAVKAGLNNDQAFALAKDAYNAAKGYTFNLTEGTQLHRATRKRNAEEHPNGKDAEDLLAEKEGRASRWGTVEFHRAARAA